MNKKCKVAIVFVATFLCMAVIWFIFAQQLRAATFQESNITVGPNYGAVTVISGAISSDHIILLGENQELDNEVTYFVGDYKVDMGSTQGSIITYYIQLNEDEANKVGTLKVEESEDGEKWTLDEVALAVKDISGRVKSVTVNCDVEAPSYSTIEFSAENYFAGETITLNICATEVLAAKPIVSMANQVASVEKIDDTNYTATLLIPTDYGDEFIKGTSISYTISQPTDLYGNIGQIASSNDVNSTSATFIGRPVLSATIIITSTGGKHIVKVGDVITATVTINGASDILSNVELSDAKIAGKTAEINGNQFTYTFKWTDFEISPIEYSVKVSEKYTKDNAFISLNGESQITFDKTAPTVTEARFIQSGNVYLTEKLTLYFTTNEPISLVSGKVSATILGQNVSVTEAPENLSQDITAANAYVATIEMTNTIFDNNPGLVSTINGKQIITVDKIIGIISKIEDIAGNIASASGENLSLKIPTKSDDLKLVNLTPPLSPTKVTVVKKISNEYSMVCAGETVIFTIQAAYPFKVIQEGTKLFRFDESKYTELPGTEDILSTLISPSTYQVTFETASMDSEERTAIPFEIKAQNTETTACDDIITIQTVTTALALPYDGIIPIISNVTAQGNSPDSIKGKTGYVNANGNIQLNFTISEADTTVGVTANVSENLIAHGDSEPNEQKWMASTLLDTIAFTEGMIIPYSVEAIDQAGNHAVTYNNLTTDAPQLVYDNTAPIIAECVYSIKDTKGNVKRESRLFDNKYYLKKNDLVTVTFKVIDEATNHAVRKPVISIFGEIVQASDVVLNAGTNTWTASYMIPEFLNGTVAGTNNIYSINAMDCAGNEAEKVELLNETFNIDTVIPEILTKEIKSNNSKNPEFVMVDNTLSVIFKTNEEVRNTPTSAAPKVSFAFCVAGKSDAIRTVTAVPVVNTASQLNDYTSWVATYTIKKSDVEALGEECIIKYSISVNDKAENQNSDKDTFIDTSIKWFPPLKITDLQCYSDNIVNSVNATGYLVEGKIPYITFKANHQITSFTGTIGGKEFKFSNTDTMYKLIGTSVQQGGIANDMSNQKVPFDITVVDNAGNILVINESNSEIYKSPYLYYMAPLEAEIKVTSDNKNDEKKYVIDENIITAELTTNNAIRNFDNAIIADKKANIEANEFTLLVTNGLLKDGQVITYKYKIQDVALQTLEKEETTEMVYFAPVILNNLSILSNNANPTFATNGNVITVEMEYNHECSIQMSTILGRQGSLPTNSQKLTSNLQINNNEMMSAEGVVNFELKAVDVAGNELRIDNGAAIENQFVTYDRTAPDIKIGPNLSGFFNKDVSITCTFLDENLGSELSLILNGEEKITSSTAAGAVGKKSFQQNISLEEEGEYELIGKATDLANNTSGEQVLARFIVDKTSPEITTTKIIMDRPQAYQSGFTIGDYFDFDEKYLNEIICRITDDSGSYDWDIDEPIVSEGKKTIFLMATDLADNTSEALSYDIYIDATAPKPIITETISGKLVENINNQFIAQLNLNIELASIQMGDEEPDTFITLKLIDENNELVVDMLNELQPSDGAYSYEVDKFGEYTLVVQAEDAVGNVSNLLSYHLKYIDKAWWEKYYDNKLLFFGTISAAIILVSISIGLFSLGTFRKKK